MRMRERIRRKRDELVRLGHGESRAAKRADAYLEHPYSVYANEDFDTLQSLVSEIWKIEGGAR